MKKLKSIDIFDILVGISIIMSLILNIIDKSYEECLWIGIAFLWYLMYIGARRKLDETIETLKKYIEKE